MPQLGALAIIELVTAAVSAAGTGYSMYEGSQQRDAQKKALAEQQTQDQQRQQMQRQAAVLAATPQAQAQTGGSLTGPAGQSFIDLLAGVGGPAGGTPATVPQAAAGAAQGTPPATLGAQQQQQMSTQDMISRLGGGQPQTQFSGGWAPASGTPNNPLGLSSFLATG